MPMHLVTLLSNKNRMIMEFKLRANIVMSKELTVEAFNLSEAMDKAQKIMAEPVPYSELTVSRIYFDEISPIKWMDEKTKVMVDNARKSMAEDLKTIREDQENLRKNQLVMGALDELLKDNADFRKQFESKLTELSLKEETAIEG